jgi:hypothetical protein
MSAWPTGITVRQQRSVCKHPSVAVVTANVPSSQILVTLQIEAIRNPKRRLLQELHGVTSQTTPFSIVSAAKISNLTQFLVFPAQFYRHAASILGPDLSAFLIGLFDATLSTISPSLI